MENPFTILDERLNRIEKMLMGLTDTSTDIKKNYQPIVPTEYLTRNEVSSMLKCDLSTIHNWCKRGKLNPYGIGNRVYFKRSEVEAVIIPLQEKKGAKHE